MNYPLPIPSAYRPASYQVVPEYSGFHFRTEKPEQRANIVIHHSAGGPTTLLLGEIVGKIGREKITLIPSASEWIRLHEEMTEHSDLTKKLLKHDVPDAAAGGSPTAGSKI